MITHAFDFGFEIECGLSDPADIPAEVLRAAIQQLIDSLPDEELLDACAIVDSVAH